MAVAQRRAVYDSVALSCRVVRYRHRTCMCVAVVPSVGLLLLLLRASIRAGAGNLGPRR